MAKTVIGIDLGLHTLKAVCIQGGAKAAVLTRASIVPQTAITESIQQAAEKALSGQIKDLITQLKGTKGECHFSLNSPSAVLRYVETPYYSQADMRSSLKLTHQTYLRQTFENFTFDGICLFGEPELQGKSKKDPKAEEDKHAKKGKTLIAGLPSPEVMALFLAATRAGVEPKSLSLAPLSLINGFQSAFPQQFGEGAVLLLDIGHSSTSLTIIHQGNIFLTRIVNVGGKNVTEYLAQTRGDAQKAQEAMVEGGDPLGEAVQSGLAPTIREVRSSINFFERNADTDIQKVYLSGTLVKAPVSLNTIQSELGFSCEVWNPAEGLQVSLPPGQRELYSENQAAFAVAIGTARAALA